MSEQETRSFEVKPTGSGASAVYRLHFIRDGKKIGHEDFHGNGTKDGDIEAQQAAQNKGENWIDLGVR